MSYKPRDPAETAGIMDKCVMFHLHAYSGQKQTGAEQRGTHLRESIPVRSVCPVGEKQEGRVRRGRADIRVKSPWERLKPKAAHKHRWGRGPETWFYWQEQSDCFRTVQGEADGNMPVASLSPTVLWARPSAPFIKDPQLSWSGKSRL